MASVADKQAFHAGRKIERLREVVGLSQAELGVRLGGISKQAVSKIERSEKIEDDRLQHIATALGMSVEAIHHFTEDMLVFHIQNMNDNSTAYAHNFQCTFNPPDKVVELYERLLQLERDKVELLKNKLKQQEQNNKAAT